ncbi:MAG: hypothetical protein QNJ97_05655 [Myxococcota bacterium]|nr:hypothetical protein [Myxococcota bacterium]
MKKLPYILLAFQMSLSLASCSSDANGAQSTTGPEFSTSDLQGNWTATEIHFSYSEVDDLPIPDHANIVGDGGSGFMTIEANGRFTLTIAPADRDDFTVGGLMFFEDGEFFAIQFDDEPDDYEYFEATLTGNTFRINGGPNTAAYDLDLDGEDDPCRVSMEFVRS